MIDNYYWEGTEAKVKKKLLTVISFIGIFILFILIKSIVPLFAPDIQPPFAPSVPEVQPQFTPEENAYITTITNQKNTLDDALIDLGELYQNAKYDSMIWKDKAATQLALIRKLFDDANEIEPPASMTQIHSKYIQTMKHFNTMAELLAQETDEMNPDLRKKAATEIETGIQLQLEVVALAEEFIKAHSQWISL